MDETPYQVLGVEPDASAEAIREAYRSVAFACHPDRNPNDPAAAERFKLATSAYEILSDDARRAAYDATGEGWGDAQGAEPDPFAPVRAAAVEVLELDVMPEVSRCIAGVKAGGPVVAHLRALGGRIAERFFARAAERVGAVAGAHAPPAEDVGAAAGAAAEP